MPADITDRTETPVLPPGLPLSGSVPDDIYDVSANLALTGEVRANRTSSASTPRQTHSVLF